jgi:hypothetical protein
VARPPSTMPVGFSTAHCYANNGSGHPFWGRRRLLGGQDDAETHNFWTFANAGTTRLAFCVSRMVMECVMEHGKNEPVLIAAKARTWLSSSGAFRTFAQQRKNRP